VSLFLSAAPAPGIILHPDGEPNLTTWTDRPHSDVVGLWGSVCSCVAISSDCVLTAKHNPDGVSTVTIGDESYIVDEIWNHSTADLKIAKLNGANLVHFADIYNNYDEVGKEVVMGGYGMVRGAELKTGGVTYGYDYNDTSYGTLYFGTNKVETTRDSFTLVINDKTYVSKVFIADFDGLGEGESTEYESAFAYYDSGGGMFIKDGDFWKVAGIIEAVEHGGQSWFRNSADPDILDPDWQWSVRLSSYVAWIYQTIPPRLQGELTGDDWVDWYDLEVFTSYWLNMDCHAPDWCAGADCEPDGDVDFEDFAELAYNWLQGESPP